ncbi:hypothetical protein AY601_2039 [Pedobacter cryoconitis]|uniref:Uncharacterized protein n=1 Tax=Pedobacter cryoconitis TaxID=188932 RepID=A0A127VC60_9SPHI|nr:hypothetical protein [Pedobacter cryoconitis]AMP98943.1 hypothetical protein AY601_2039 [Pedobacter cryoconitis]
MNLIGRNKIANYILKHSQSRVVLLTFLKEFPYRHEQHTAHSSVQVDGTFQMDGFDCLIKVRTNHFAKAINILELTTKEEEMNKWEQKRKEQEATGIGEEIINQSVTVVVTFPPPDIEDLDQLEQSNNKEVVANLFHPELKELAIGTADEYEQNLDRVNILFDAKPETPEFEELLTLLPKVIDYEEYMLEFPKLKIFEAVKNRIDFFSITPIELRYIIGTDHQVDLFFSGNLELADDVLGKLYEFVALRAPVTDKRFF